MTDARIGFAINDCEDAIRSLTRAVDLLLKVQRDLERMTGNNDFHPIGGAAFGVAMGLAWIMGDDRWDGDPDSGPGAVEDYSTLVELCRQETRY